MAQLQTAAQLLKRLGAVAPETAVRLMVEACEALQAHGSPCALTLESLRVSEEPGTHAEIDPAPFSAVPGDPARAQVSTVAAVGYELLRGMPPPERPDSGAWFGVRPELAALLGPALSGSGPPTVAELAHQLRTIARPGTAQYVAPEADTVIPARPSQPSPPVPADRHVGEVFGSWELTRRLGSGGMGDVFQARHVKLGREVAIKLLKPELAADPDIVRRFFDEARVVNEINHPHIVEVHDFVEEPGRVYCVMELLEGRSLADLVAQDGALEPKRVAALFAQVCAALQAAHQRGVVHRDIKPDNIFVSADPKGGDFARVLDFGIARRLSGDRRTQQGLVMGTFHFMAPEQAAGRTVDARADLYSVGVSMVEALTGRPPHEGALAVPTTTPRGEPLPHEWVTLLQRCLSLDPAGRPRDAAELGQALSALARNERPPRPSTDAIQQAAGVAPARRTGRAIVGVGAVLLVGFAVVFFERDALFGAVPAPREEITVAPAPAPVPVVEVPPPLPAPVVMPAPPPVHHPAKTGKGTAAPLTRPSGTLSHGERDADLARVAALQRDYDQLVQRYGESQLTTLERAAVRQALDDARDGRDTQLKTSIPPAEAALEAAAHRLSK